MNAYMYVSAYVGYICMYISAICIQVCTYVSMKHIISYISRISEKHFSEHACMYLCACMYRCMYAWVGMYICTHVHMHMRQET